MIVGRSDVRSARAEEPSSDGGPRLQIMGPLRVWRGGNEVVAGPRQQRRLLAVLLAREGRPTSTDDLLDLLWGPETPASAVNVIHKYVAALRRLLEPDLPARAAGSYLLRHGDGYLLAAGPETLDLVAFRRDVAAAKVSLRQDRPVDALEHYLAALGRCHGRSADGLVDSAVAAALLAGIDGEFFDATIAAAAVATRLRQPARVLAPLRLAAEMSRLNEPVHASLVTTLAAAGQQAEALAVYGAIRARLNEELGIDPGYQLQDAQRRALTQAVLPPVEDAALAVSRPAPLVRPAQLPPDPPLFVGRESELLILRDLAAGMRAPGRTSPLVVAMDGMGGVGKSTLATHFAHRVADEFADGQLYLDLQGHLGEGESVSADEAVRSLLHMVGVPAADVPDTFDARIGLYRSMTAGKHILFLLDNARDAAQVRPLLPNSAQSLVLVTGRRALVGLAAFDGAHLLRVDLPDLPAARRLLARRLTGLSNRSTGGVACAAAVADEIIELCGRLPLALAILAARIAARPRLSLATIAAELRDGARRLEAFPGGRGLTDPRTAFSWSYRQLSPGAARLFRLLSVAPPSGVTAEACVSLVDRDPDSTRAELAELIEAALVTEHHDGRLTSHVLVKAYAHELFQAQEPAAERQAAISRLLQHYLHSSFQAQVALDPNRPPIEPPAPLPGVVAERPGTYDEAIAWFGSQREVLKEAVRLAADVGYGIVPWQLAIAMQQYLQWAGRFQDWEDVMRVALRAARERHDAVGEAHVLRSLAGARHYFGAHDEALGLLGEAARIYQDRDLRLEQALVHNNCHQVFSALNQHDRALDHSLRALSLFRLLDNRRGEMSSLLFSGKSLTALGQVEKSAQALREALDLNQRIGRAHEESDIRTSIADNLVVTGRVDEAVEQLELAADAARRVGNRPSQFDALRQMADVLITAGDQPGARRAFERAGAVLRELQDGGTDGMRASVTRLAAKLA
ncbi:AfsR/SARP family transcriptional regulator [Micromonospora lupini]|uniref:Transcriptional regulator, SARP family n=1 Tax=Micromonospora lupini str. Lupac 08 TaxID=1150864 RepID=I0KZM7_9ACTN|nr:BTAD domain-containing putative transcriptional regulator [Micromonospora lupini]CCH17024.1 Transcriptional regulator, SARP family [Micromonospora lupini str. Lupac 08]